MRKNVKVNTKQTGDCGYLGVWAGIWYEVYANSSYRATEILRDHIKPAKSKRHLVEVHLAEYANGEPAALFIAR